MNNSFHFLIHAHHSSPGSRDGYFEMGLDDSCQETICSSSTSLDAPPAGPSGPQVQLCEEEVEEEEEEGVKVIGALWCYCLQLDEQVEQKKVCLVLTDQMLGLLYLSDDFTWTNHDTGK